MRAGSAIGLPRPRGTSVDARPGGRPGPEGGAGERDRQGEEQGDEEVLQDAAGQDQDEDRGDPGVPASRPRRRDGGSRDPLLGSSHRRIAVLEMSERDEPATQDVVDRLRADDRVGGPLEVGGVEHERERLWAPEPAM